MAMPTQEPSPRQASWPGPSIVRYSPTPTMMASSMRRGEGGAGAVVRGTAATSALISRSSMALTPP